VTGYGPADARAAAKNILKSETIAVTAAEKATEKWIT
jgi:hypothetical protein